MNAFKYAMRMSFTVSSGWFLYDIVKKPTTINAILFALSGIIASVLTYSEMRKLHDN